MIVVSGAAHVVRGDETQDVCDASPFLRVPKSRKYMGLQDELAVFAAGNALRAAGLRAPLGERTGLYLAVGYIPFEQRDAEPVLDASLDAHGEFDLPSFAARGWRQAHPLITFRCLPNMPAYHVSVNFGIEGPYLVSYPGAGQLYLGLEAACAALDCGAIDVALCGGVADQRNFLVAHHHARLLPAVAREQLRDVAGVLVLEREADAHARGARVRARLDTLQVAYTAFDPTCVLPAATQRFEGPADDDPTLELGPASLPIGLSRNIERGERGAWRALHVQCTRDGYRCQSAWSAP